MIIANKQTSKKEAELVISLFQLASWKSRCIVTTLVYTFPRPDPTQAVELNGLC